MAPIEIPGPEGLRQHQGKELGVSEWCDMTQEAVDAFADATGDHQWIHVDVERAAASPMGGTIAHGLFVLSLGPRFNEEIFRVTGFDRVLNYGYDKVRFPAPTPVGSRLRMRATLADVIEVPGGLRTVVTQTFEVEGGEKPVCVAAAVSQWVL
ncbi:MAG TPA: MaoC family dehydratase [Solirubrobacterales bacterium]